MKNKELEQLLIEVGILRADLSKAFNANSINRLFDLNKRKDEIMRKQFLEMKSCYFAHPMKTYFPGHCCYEKRFYEIMDRELIEKDGKLRILLGDENADKLRSGLINPNTEEYKWKGEEGTDMHSSDEWGFSWRKFAVSMPHYCGLVLNSDGLIWGPIFEHNKRKNAKSKWIRRVPRGMKTEISCTTKCGCPTMTLIRPEVVTIDGREYILPTDIGIPSYMIDHIDARVEWEYDDSGNTYGIIYNPNIAGTIYNDNMTILGFIDGKGDSEDVVRDHNNNPISELIKGNNGISDFIHIIGMGGSLEGDVIKGLNTLGGKVMYKEGYWRSENKGRYNSPNPFDMYYDTRSGEIHEKPTKYGDWVVFEPWNKEFMDKYL